MSKHGVYPEPKSCPDGGVMTFVRDDYDWWGEGDYEIYDCTEHGRVWIPLPD